MLLSAVSVLVVAQSSSEIPEGLMNTPVYCIAHPLCLEGMHFCKCTSINSVLLNLLFVFTPIMIVDSFLWKYFQSVVVIIIILCMHK